MPLHRKATHRPKILAAALGVAATVSGVAYAAQVGQQPVRSAPEPLRTVSPSSSATSDLASLPADHGERGLRPTRSAPADRARLGERPRRPSRNDEGRKASTPSPLPSGTAGSVTGATPKTPAGSTSFDPAPTAARGASSSGSGILDGTNAARADAGLPPLSGDTCLARMAERHAQRLAAAGRLYHQDLAAVMRSCGTSTAGENVAMNYTGPSDMVDQWLKSPGHRANLLSSRFSLIGVGVARARDGAWYGVQVFGDR